MPPNCFKQAAWLLGKAKLCLLLIRSDSNGEGRNRRSVPSARVLAAFLPFALRSRGDRGHFQRARKAGGNPPFAAPSLAQPVKHIAGHGRGVKLLFWRRNRAAPECCCSGAKLGRFYPVSSCNVRDRGKLLHQGRNPQQGLYFSSNSFLHTQNTAGLGFCLKWLQLQSIDCFRFFFFPPKVNRVFWGCNLYQR